MRVRDNGTGACKVVVDAGMLTWSDMDCSPDQLMVAPSHLLHQVPPPHPIGGWGSAPTRKMLTSWFLSLLISYTKCSPQWGAVLPSPLRWLWESLMHIFREMGFNSCQFLPRTIVFPLHKGECLSPLLNACFFVPSCKCHLSLNTLPQLVLRICLGY